MFAESNYKQKRSEEINEKLFLKKIVVIYGRQCQYHRERIRQQFFFIFDNSYRSSFKSKQYFFVFSSEVLRTYTLHFLPNRWSLLYVQVRTASVHNKHVFYMTKVGKVLVIPNCSTSKIAKLLPTSYPLQGLHLHNLLAKDFCY